MLIFNVILSHSLFSNNSTPIDNYQLVIMLSDIGYTVVINPACFIVIGLWFVPEDCFVTVYMSMSLVYVTTSCKLKVYQSNIVLLAMCIYIVLIIYALCTALVFIMCLPSTNDITLVL